MKQTLENTIEQLPPHLKKYIYSQNYSKYTGEDQAIWKYIIRTLKIFLKTRAHSCYMEGLAKSGITENEIPHIDLINEKLQDFGWNAVPISGFITPSAFMEFQSLGILPIATDLRTIEHILYTPAPDIAHESAGHAPILIDPQFSQYLKHYATIASKAIFSKEDLDVYEAIRDLSDIKENPSSTKNDIHLAEKKLEVTFKSVSYDSEATLLSRMNWWTAEYGLIGDINKPKIFGAGLLSSIGESQNCLNEEVKKIPLTIDCIKQTYDITEMQPQLFVTPNFQTLIDVLNDLSETMSYKIGGAFGVNNAIKSRTVNTVELDSGLQVSGILAQSKSINEKISYLNFTGPTQLAYQNKELNGHGITYHKEGFGCLVDQLKGEQEPIYKFDNDKLQKYKIVLGQITQLEFKSGVVVKGEISDLVYYNETLLLIAFKKCTVTLGEEKLFDPSWGTYDMVTGSDVVSVYGSPADRSQYEPKDSFITKKIPDRKYTNNELLYFKMYEGIKKMSNEQLIAHSGKYFSEYSDKWLLGLELLEAASQLKNRELINKLTAHLNNHAENNNQYKPVIENGLNLIKSL